MNINIALHGPERVIKNLAGAQTPALHGPERVIKNLAGAQTPTVTGEKRCSAKCKA
ncbi:hypothetical protein DOY81_006303 [Sarcophaga bullata]|nr:hypothetical protein DOY81_006303 [Sarcophaga bullata]